MPLAFFFLIITRKVCSSRLVFVIQLLARRVSLEIPRNRFLDDSRMRLVFVFLGGVWGGWWLVVGERMFKFTMVVGIGLGFPAPALFPNAKSKPKQKD